MKGDSAAYAAVLALIVAGAIAMVTGLPRLWGLHFGWYLPGWYPVAAIGLALLLWLPPVAARLSRGIEFVSLRASGLVEKPHPFSITSSPGAKRRGDLTDHQGLRLTRIACGEPRNDVNGAFATLPSNGPSRWIWAPAAIILCGMALLFPAKTYLLGDAPLRLNQIDAGRLLLTTEIGDFFIHAALQRYVLGPLGFNAADNYALVAAIMAIPFVAGCFCFTRRLDPKRWLGWFLILLTSGAVVQFFGYVESYAILLALLPWVMWAALRSVDGRGIGLCLILFLLASLVHFAGAILLSGAVAAVILMRLAQSDQTVRRATTAMAVTALVAVVVAYAARAAGLFEARQWLIPVRPDESFAYGLLTVDHLLNLFNWLALSAPLVLILPFLLVAPKQPPSDGPRAGRLALARLSLLSSGLFLLLFAPRLGGPRDWDLFAVAGVVALHSAIVWLARRRPGPLPRPVVPVIGLGLATVAAFVAVNASAKRSVERFADVIEVGPVKNLYQEYANLCDHCLRYPELSDRLDDFAVAAWEQPPYRTVDSAEALGYLLQSYDHVTHPDSLIDSLTIRLDIDPDDYAFYDLLARMWTGGSTPAQKVALAYHMYELYPDRARALMHIGSLWAQVGNRDAAREALESAYAMDSGNPSVLTTYGQFLFATGRIDDAHALLSRAVEAAPDDFRVHILTSQTAAAVGDTAQALRLLNRADSLADSPTKSQAVEGWRERLGQGNG